MPNTISSNCRIPYQLRLNGLVYPQLSLKKSTTRDQEQQYYKWESRQLYWCKRNGWGIGCIKRNAANAIGHGKHMWVLQLQAMKPCISTSVLPTNVNANKQAMLLSLQLACKFNVTIHLKAVIPLKWACTLLLFDICTSKLVSSKVTHHNIKKAPRPCNMS